MSASADNDPNIVLFMVDQLSARWLEEPAINTIPTPNIDRLRSEGVTFTNTIPSNPLCTPARATISTGLTTRGHGVLQNGYRLDPQLPTFMRLLQNAGWRTGAAGKVHHIPHYESAYPEYEQYGFDVTHITEDSRVGEWLDWIREKHPEHVEDVLATIWATNVPALHEYGPDGENLASRIDAIRDDYEWTTEEFPENTPLAHTLPFPKELSQTEWITRHGEEFIRETDRDQQFFAQISYVQPHSPSEPPAEYIDDVETDEIPEPSPVEWVDDPAAPDWFSETEGARTSIPDDWRRRRQYFFADVVHLDEQLGRVLDTLEKTGRRENTYVIFLSDHGELLLDHGFTGKNERHYDTCIRVPLTIAGPGLEEGIECDEFIQFVDIFPTILDMAGVSSPDPTVMGSFLDEQPEYLQGDSLLPFCRGESPDDWRTEAYVESYNNIDSLSPKFWPRTIRTQEFRYTWYPHNSGQQLFKVDEDPHEQENLVDDPDFEDVRRELHDCLLEHVVLQDYPHSPRDRFAYGVH